MAGVRERGESLVEILITLMLIGIGVSALLTALTTGMRSSQSTQKTADSRALLVAGAEQVQVAQYVACAGLTGYDTALTSAAVARNSDGSNAGTVTVQVKSIAYWTSTAAGVLNFSASDCAYDNDATADSRMQRITLVSSSDETLTFVKRAS